jgi:2-dehydro-3-deoxyphosphogluconate aldolase/(4S)-4-hydroxy-2-oxoglutarate aldolase
MNPTLAQHLSATRLVPVVVIDDAAKAVDLAGALLEAGLGVIEITFRTPAAAEAIRRIARECPRMLTGAGTLLTGEQVRHAVDAGATFGLAPGLDPATVEAARAAGLDFIPGVMTPGEVQQALALGCAVQKFFPAEQTGGAAFLKALEGPYGHTGVRFIPTGGLNAGNIAPYLALKTVAALGGSWFVDKKLIEAADWPAITRLTREALTLTSPTSVLISEH